MIAAALALLATISARDDLTSSDNTLHISAVTCPEGRCCAPDSCRAPSPGAVVIPLDAARSRLPTATAAIRGSDWVVVFGCTIEGNRFQDCGVQSIDHPHDVIDLAYALSLTRQVRVAPGAVGPRRRARLGISYSQIGCPVTSCNDVFVGRPTPSR